MATIDIGKIKPVFKGTYDGSTAYVLDDIVYYNGSSYVAKTSTTGNIPTNGTYWEVVAVGSGGIWNSALSLGSAGQVVKVNSGASALEFANDGGASIVSAVSTDISSYGNTATLDPLAITITPKSTSSKILFMASCHGEFTQGGWDVTVELRRAISGGATTDLIDALQSVGDRNGFAAPYSSYGVGDNDSTPDGFNIMVVDTPNTTSACEYKMVFQTTGESFKFNRCVGSAVQERFASTAVAIDFGG